MSVKANDTLSGGQVDVSHPGSQTREHGGPMSCFHHWGGGHEGYEWHREERGRVFDEQAVSNWRKWAGILIPGPTALGGTEEGVVWMVERPERAGPEGYVLTQGSKGKKSLLHVKCLVGLEETFLNGGLRCATTFGSLA